MTRVVLWMRHGTCDDGLRRPEAHARPDSPLTVAGAVETECTARGLTEQIATLPLVISSPLRRARQTASIVANTLGTNPAAPVELFTEWHAPSCVLGCTSAQYPPAYRAWREQRAHDVDSALPGGESLRAFARRASEATRTASDLSGEHGPVLIVSHRLLIGAVAALHHGHHHPADIFGFASEFRLGPAELWAPHPADFRGH